MRHFLEQLRGLEKQWSNQMSNYNPLTNPKDTVHTIQRMIDDAALPPVSKNESVGIASASGSGGIASETPVFDSLWSSYEEAVANSNVGWLRGYSLTPAMSAVIGGGETLADGMFTFDVPNKILGLGNATTLGCELRIFESGGGGYFGLVAAAASANKTYTWPNTWPASTKGLQFSNAGIGSWFTPVINFTDLADVPTAYTGAANRFVKVNAGATGLEFIAGGGGGGSMSSFNIDGTSGGPITVNDADTITFAAGFGIKDIVLSAGPIVTINSDWTRDSFGTFLSPTTPNDYLSIIQNTSSAPAAAFQYAHTSGSNHALTALTSSSANDSYGISVDKLRVTSFLDLHWEGSIPAAPPTFYNRLYVDNGLLYYKVPGGSIIGPLIEHIQYWNRTGTDLSPLIADDNIILHDGSKIGWGDGNPGTLDTWMKRGGVGRIDVGDNTTSYLFRVWGGASTNYIQLGSSVRSVLTLSTDTAFQSLISTDTNARLLIDASGHYGLGAGGAGTIDTGFGRTAANLLQMDTGDSFQSDNFIVTASGQITSANTVGGVLNFNGYATTPGTPQNLITITNGLFAPILDFPQGFTYAGGAIPLSAGGTGQITAALAIAALGQFNVVPKTSDETLTNSAVLQDDDVLQFSVTAGKLYAFKFVFAFTTTAAADFKFGLTYTQTEQFCTHFADQVIPGVGGSVSPSFTRFTTFGNSTSLSGTGTTGGFVRIEGIMKAHATNAGTLKLQWAQAIQTNDSGIILHAGSYCEYRQLD